jgi:transcriptional regulator with GAF, ATPase, and Fis domain
MDALVSYPWPGNVRELENLIERAVLLSRGKELRVPLAELKEFSPASVFPAVPGDFAPPTATTASPAPAPSPASTLDEAQRQHILRVLRQTRWRIAGPKGAAAILGMKRTTLQARMRKLGIQRPI